MNVQRMEPAPPLPGILDHAPIDVCAVPPPEPPAIGGPIASPPDVVQRARDFTQAIARVHQEYLRLSSDRHGEFLAMWESATAALVGASPEPRVAVPAPPTPPVNEREHPKGPAFGRDDLIILSSGRISSVFGERFTRQDGHRHQLRPAKPPLLLADRITGIDAAPGSQGNGTLWSETDVVSTSWYLDDAGRMPAAVLPEAGQAHLALLSWLGFDWQHSGDLRYRLSGCEMTIHGAMPQAGDTCVYDIHLDRQAQFGDAKIFFVHFGCTVDGELRGSVRIQVGLFSDEQLAAAGTVTWTAAADARALEGALDPPYLCTERRRFSREAVRAFANGRPADCFGPGFERANAHVRTPKVTAGPLLQLDEVEAFDPKGGPWGRGYLRATTPIAPDAWFFAAHFHDDPCMPGFLVIDAGFQAIAFYSAALGFTLNRDGWRFEPVPGTYTITLKGQVTPVNRRLTYELFVESVSSGPEPAVVADILMAIDGRPAFHMRRAKVRLVPDVPLEYWRRLGPPAQQETGDLVPISSLGGLAGHVDQGEVACVDGMAYGYASVLAMAWGRSAQSVGPAVRAGDLHYRTAHLPGPPFLFLSRIARLDAALGEVVGGSAVDADYDVPTRVWYFEQNGAATMPFSVLLEAMLQVCGWLTCFTGSNTDLFAPDLVFRNLEGTLTVWSEVGPTAGTLRTRVMLIATSQLPPVCLFKMEVHTFAGDRRVAEVQTDFGLFPLDAFRNQVGLPPSDEERARVEAPSSFFVDLTLRPARYFARAPRLAGPMLLMLQRVTGFWPDGGPAGLGYVRAEKDVDPAEWFFKAHFFEDPVQPGSLGIEGLCQLLQFYMIERDMGAGISNARFETPMLDRPVTWKYRGQVVPENGRVTMEIVITEAGADDRGPFAVADGWLWVDGTRVYHVSNLGVRIVGGA